VQHHDLSRVGAFSDGVMAVAITLLVLNIETPDVATDDLGDALIDLLPSLGAYVLSFALIGRFWFLHHRLFDTFARADSRLLVLNLVFLMLIALVPFATDLSDRYSTAPIAAATFGATLGLAALANWSMGDYARRAGLLKESAVQGVVDPADKLVGLGIALVFFLSVPVAFLSATLAWLMWASVMFIRYPLRNVARWVSR
jgi:uncharacterized membrane protein